MMVNKNTVKKKSATFLLTLCSLGRNHKVTFHLEHESSECDDEDSDR